MPTTYVKICKIMLNKEYPVILCLLILAISRISYALYPQDVTYFNAKEKTIQFSNNVNSRIRNSSLVEWGLTIPNGTEGVLCTDGDECIDYGSAKVVVTYDGECETVSWTSVSLSELKDCVNILDGHWYGGGQQNTQPWPIEKNSRTEVPYVTADMLQDSNWYGGLSERYWISSLGVSLQVDDTVPLFLSLPDQDSDEDAEQICLASRFDFPFATPPGGNLTLKYELCYANDVKEVHEMAFPRYFNFPSDIPDERMMTHPIWSTWAEYKTAVNQSLVIDLAQSILDNGFNNSQLEIDDNWETCYGEAIFDPLKFPDPAAMVATLHDMGFRVTLWTHPFINDNCPTFTTADEAGYFIKNSTNSTQLTSWWQGRSSGIIDFTNTDAVQWWSQRLVDLQAQTGIDSFKFDAGETSWLPQNYTLNSTEELWPNEYTTSYVDAVSAFGNLIEVRVGHLTHHQPAFVRMLDKDSIWSEQNGLRTMVPSLLHSEILGYPFCLPDMVGGNAYLVSPDDELFVRWAQSNTFMPAIQFSILPWNYGDQVVNLTREVTSLHAAFAPLIINLAENSTSGVAPIARPTWWLCPEDENCLLADQQFLLGDDILVTPVVYEGATTLDVVFPPGTWQRADTGEEFVGISTDTLTDITIDSNVYFIKI